MRTCNVNGLAAEATWFSRRASSWATLVAAGSLTRGPEGAGTSSLLQREGVRGPLQGMNH